MTETLNAHGETFEAFSKRIFASAADIPVRRGGRSVPLSSLSEKDQKAHVDRWWLEGADPLAKHAASGGSLSQIVADSHAQAAPAPTAATDAGETFHGWVQRALVPGPGFEWATVELPRYVVEGMAKPDKIGRIIRKDTREVMTHEIIAKLASWDLGNRVRK